MARWYRHRKWPKYQKRPKPRVIPAPTREELAKRFKKYQRIVKVLESRLANPEFLAEEERKRQNLEATAQKYAELTRRHENLLEDLHASLITQIDALYSAESSTYQALRDARDWLSKLGDAIFRVSLSEFIMTFPPHPKSPYKQGETKNYGRYLPSPETNLRVKEITQEYTENLAAIREQQQTKSMPFNDEVKPFRPFKSGGFLVTEIDKARALLADVEGELEKLGASEAQVRREYGFDDTTVARAAAYAGLTRDLAKKIRPVLFTQLQQSCLCPYCGQDLGETPYADHIFPVSLGGLSTPENMVLVCETCNTQKCAFTLNEFMMKFGLDRTLIEANLLKLKKRF